MTVEHVSRYAAPQEGEPAIYVCEACGYEQAAKSGFCLACKSPLNESVPLPNVLQAGVRLSSNQYSVGRVLGQGQVGITYLGSEIQKQRPVAIKEFYPEGSGRDGNQVVAGAGVTKEEFDGAKERFLNAGKVLHKFQHPGIVRILDIFEENGTAYVAMEHLRGKTFDELVKARTHPIGEEEAVGYITKVADALTELHKAGHLHQNIGPRGIIVTEDGRTVLMELGSARRFLHELMSQHTLQLTPGFAAPEQYSKMALRGPFTDVYGVGAVLYFLLTGLIPPAAAERAVGLPLESITMYNPGVSEAVTRAVVQAMSMDWSARPQELSDFARMLKVRARRKGRVAMLDPAPSLDVADEPDVLVGHTNWVRSVAFSPDGTKLASASDDRTVRVWKLDTMEETRKLKGHTGWVRCLAFGTDPNLMATGSMDQTLRFWNVESGVEERRLSTSEGLLALQFSPDDELLATGGSDNSVKIWGGMSGRVFRVLNGHEGPVVSVSFDPDSNVLASAGLDDGDIRLWTVGSGRSIGTLSAHTDWVTAVVFAPHGPLLASASYDNSVRFWDMGIGKETFSVTEGSPVLALAYSPNGELLVYGTWSGDVVVFDVVEGRELQRFKGHKGPVLTVAFAPDGKTLASGAQDRSIRIWHLERPGHH